MYNDFTSKQQGSAQASFYVSRDGNDSGPGTESEPFATLHKARDAVRALKNSAKGPIVVYVRTGMYYLPEPLTFTAADSGTDETPIVYAVCDGEEAVISGGSRLALEWSPYRDGIWQAAVPEGLDIDQLFVDGTRYHMARYPNYDPNVAIFNGYASDCMSNERAESWSDPCGGYIHAMHKHMWGGYHYRITGKDENGTLLYEGGWQNNRQMGMHEEYRFVENIFEELDAPGEWYLDRKANLLYVYPYQGTDLGKAVIETARLRHLIEFKGTEAEPVSGITLKGFVFRHASRTFMETREPLLRSDWTIYRGGAVFFEGSEDCGLEDCFLDRLGGNAVFVSGFNRRIAISGCHIAEAGANGIAFVGKPSAVRSPLFEYAERQGLKDIDCTPGPLTNDYPADCIVEDCLIYRSGRYEKQTSPIQISMSLNITVRHCSIYDVPRAGINVSEGTWGGHLIEYNDVFDTVLETGDHGSFNSWGRDRYWELNDIDLNGLHDPYAGGGRSELPVLDTIKPIIIRNNRWRCDHGWDIDLDDGSSHYHIYNNLCLNGGIKLREGFYRICENNVMVNNSFHPHVWYKGSQDVFRKNIIFEPYKPIRIPEPWGEECDHNFLHIPGQNEALRAETLQQQSGRDANSVAGDADFVDPGSGDYRVSSGSPACKMGFVNFPMDRFGVRKEVLRKIARKPQIPNSFGSVGSDRDTRVYEWNGVRVKNVTGLGEVSAFGLAGEQGVWVVSISDECGLAKAGLQETDVILAYAGRKVDVVEDLLKMYNSSFDVTPIRITVFRNQREHIFEYIPG